MTEGPSLPLGSEGTGQERPFLSPVALGRNSKVRPDKTGNDVPVKDRVVRKTKVLNERGRPRHRSRGMPRYKSLRLPDPDQVGHYDI